MLAAHNAIAISREANPQPEVVIRNFYNTNIAIVADVNYTVPNFIGGWYRVNNHDHMHDNWLNQAIEEIFNPIVGRSLTNRPTLKRLNIIPTTNAQANQINPYSLSFAYNDVNLQTLLNLASNLSDFTKKSNRGSHIDGVTIPVPNQWDSLLDNNSRFRSGSIPVNQIYPPIPNQALPICISARVPHDEKHDPIGIAIVDMTRNIIPRFGNQHVVAPQARLPSFAPVPIIHRPNDAFTYTASNGNNDHPVEQRKFYLWSSYRYSESPNASTPTVHFFFTLRGMYGTAVLLQRSENPARLLPR